MGIPYHSSLDGHWMGRKRRRSNGTPSEDTLQARAAASSRYSSWFTIHSPSNSTSQTNTQRGGRLSNGRAFWLFISSPKERDATVWKYLNYSEGWMQVDFSYFYNLLWLLQQSIIIRMVYINYPSGRRGLQGSSGNLLLYSAWEKYVSDIVIILPAAQRGKTWRNATPWAYRLL